MISWTIFWVVFLVALTIWVLWGMIKVSRDNQEGDQDFPDPMEMPPFTQTDADREYIKTLINQEEAVKQVTEVPPEVIAEEKPKRIRKKAITGPASDAQVTKKRRSKKK